MSCSVILDCCRKTWTLFRVGDDVTLTWITRREFVAYCFRNKWKRYRRFYCIINQSPSLRESVELAWNHQTVLDLASLLDVHYVIIHIISLFLKKLIFMHRESMPLHLRSHRFLQWDIHTIFIKSFCLCIKHQASLGSRTTRVGEMRANDAIL